MQESNHVKRIRGGILLAFLGFSSLALGGLTFVTICGISLTLAIKEFIQMAKASGAKPLNKALLVLVIGYPICASYSYQLLVFWFTFSLILIIGLFLVRAYLFPQTKATLADLSISIFSIVYIGWFSSHIVLLRFMEEPFQFFHFNLADKGLFYAFLPIISVITNDIASYYFGKAFGKTKLAESISPNKTVKGSVAGIIAGTLVGILVTIYLAPIFKITINLQIISLVILLINIFAQMGDLVESLIKRSVGVKDAGGLIEGHGGLLDRFDSHIIPYVLSYYFFASYNSLTQ
ncbi:MAG: CDP-archaeol synthase [Candidatus Caenarcaniphilales bacterium]|nr:CDP-archaeol synthase [Candidatus Caenarcaniphilales bacterium]